MGQEYEIRSNPAVSRHQLQDLEGIYQSRVCPIRMMKDSVQYPTNSLGLKWVDSSVIICYWQLFNSIVNIETGSDE